MNKEKLEMLNEYLKNTNIPVLVEDIPLEIFSDYVIIPSDINVKELDGHYEKTEYCPPSWYTSLVDKYKENKAILVITDINKISKNDQGKFVEILKYKKVSTFDLPKDVRIILTANNLKENEINEEIYSLLAHI